MLCVDVLVYMIHVTELSVRENTTYVIYGFYGYKALNKQTNIHMKLTGQI